MILRGKTEFYSGWLAGLFRVPLPENVSRRDYDTGHRAGSETWVPELQVEEILVGPPDAGSMREDFEERLFNQMFLSSIQKVGTGCMTFQSVGCPTMEAAMRRGEDGLYLDNSVNAAWWAWQAALEWAQKQ